MTSDIWSGACRQRPPTVIDPTTHATWDAHLANFPDATIFHTAAWARVLRDTYGFTPLYCVSEGESEREGATALRAGDRSSKLEDRAAANTPRLRRNSDLQPALRSLGEVGSAISALPDITAVLPLMEVESWLTGRRGVSLPFTDSCPLLGLQSAAVPFLFDEALRLAKSRSWRYLECRGVDPGRLAAPASTTYWGHGLDLIGGEHALLAGCDSATRRAIRKAEKSGLTVGIENNIEAVRAFYALHCLTRKRHGQPPQPFRFFANIHRHILAANQGFIVLARRRGDLIAANMFFRHEKTSIYKFGASDHRLQELRASNLVMWEGIKHCVRLGCTTLDFGRTTLGQEGLRRFKLGWGTKETRIDYLRHDVRSARFVSVPDRATGWHRLLFRALPVRLARLAGRLLYRHVG